MELHQYLSQYKQVSIPEVGSIELEYEPASLDVASKMILPPAYRPQFSNKDAVREHQLHFLAAGLHTEQQLVQEQLQHFGKELKRKIQHDAFVWRGLGKLQHSDARILFHADALPNERLQPVIAQKILRENVRHTVLVGEQEVQKSTALEDAAPGVEKKSYATLIGWMLIAAAAVFIFFMLYKGNFQTPASGNKTKIVPAQSR